MRGSIILLILFINICLSSFSQEDTTNFNEYFPEEIGERKWKPLISLDARRSFFRGRPVKINGFRVGVQYLGVHRIGLGFYGLDKNVVFSDVKVNYPGSTDTSRVIFNAGYGTLFYERVLYKTEKWEFALPSELLLGSITGYYEDSLGKFLPLPQKSFTGLSSGIQVKYNIFTWLAPRFSVGYRLLLNALPEVRYSFNRAYYSFGLQVLVGELVVKSKFED